MAKKTFKPASQIPGYNGTAPAAGDRIRGVIDSSTGETKDLLLSDLLTYIIAGFAGNNLTVADLTATGAVNTLNLSVTGNAQFSALPTSTPSTGFLWNSAGDVRVA